MRSSLATADSQRLQAPHEPEWLLQRLADAIDQVFWFTEIDPERVVYVSPAFEVLWGRKIDDLYRDSRIWVQAIHPQDRARVMGQFEDWLQERIPDYRVEYRVVRPDGSIRTILDQGAQIRDEQGRPSFVSGVAKDITEEKEAKDALQRALTDLTRLKESLQLENVYLQEEIKRSHGSKEIVGESDPLKITLSKIEQVARTDASVLLLGETGTGKELFARSIHRASPRKDRPLVKVNCAALPSALIESELFGHIKGAFTGAIADRIGRFQLADRGTIFLDEIGELDLELQAKLLRVLQEGEFEQIGSAVTTRVDVRIVAASNRDLHRAINEGLFRADLYYRLAVFPIEVPPLRVRREDIPLLVHHFISKKKARLGKQIEEVSATTMNALVEYDWPGNVRELENVIERAMILSPGTTLALDESLDRSRRSKPAQGSMPATLEQIDRAHIIGVLEDCDWIIKGAGRAAQRLGLAPSTLRYRMKKLGINRPPAKSR